MSGRDDVVLKVRGLTTVFRSRHGLGRAVNDVGFDLRRGEVLGLIGESGSGKTMTALSILRMLPPGAKTTAGTVKLNGVELLSGSRSRMESFRGKHLAYIPQDPTSSLNPVHRVGRQIAEPLRTHRGLRGSKATQRVIELLGMVQVPAPGDRLRDFPHQFSGGMRQRVVSAAALSCTPEVLIADEPTTSLDVTVQAAYLSMLRAIQSEHGMGVLFITHDFGIVASICDRVIVMYGGRVVEMGPTPEIFERPLHPYTRGLIDCLPDLTRASDALPEIPGRPPSIFNLPAGCPFFERCPHQTRPSCAFEVPPLRRFGIDHYVATYCEA